MFWDCALSGGILWAFFFFSLLLLTKIFLNWIAGSVCIIFPIFDCWKLSWKKHYCWSSMTEKLFFFPSFFLFHHCCEDNAHILAIVSKIIAKRNHNAFTFNKSHMETSDVIVFGTCSTTHPEFTWRRLQVKWYCFISDWLMCLVTQKEARTTCSS